MFKLKKQSRYARLHGTSALLFVGLLYFRSL